MPAVPPKLSGESVPFVGCYNIIFIHKFTHADDDDYTHSDGFPWKRLARR